VEYYVIRAMARIYWFYIFVSANSQQPCVTCAIIGYNVPLDSFDKYALNTGLNISQEIKVTGHISSTVATLSTLGTIKAVTAHLSSTLSTPVILVSVDTEMPDDYMLCCCADTTKAVYDCTEILSTEVAPAFEQIPTLIETKGGLRRIVASQAYVFLPMRRLDEGGHA
jgi:hypothetical protein